MKETWFGCPSCFLAFAEDEEYRRHFLSDHPKKKFRLAAKLASAVGY